MRAEASRSVDNGDGRRDIAVASPFVNLGHLECELVRSRHARTCAYVERILARPSFAAWIGREAAFLAKTAA